MRENLKMRSSKWGVSCCKYYCDYGERIIIMVAVESRYAKIINKILLLLEYFLSEMCQSK
jgi:hypothetical protein